MPDMNRKQKLKEDLDRAVTWLPLVIILAGIVLAGWFLWQALQ